MSEEKPKRASRKTAEDQPKYGIVSLMDGSPITASSIVRIFGVSMATVQGWVASLTPVRSAYGIMGPAYDPADVARAHMPIEHAARIFPDEPWAKAWAKAEAAE